MRNAEVLALLVSVPFALTTACGGDQKNEPASPVSAVTPAEPAEPAEATPPPAEATPSAPADAPADAPTEAPDAGAPAPSPSGVVIGEAKDECTPVSVDFEKRARPKLKACYAEGKKKDPNLEGTVKLKITVDVKGKIKSTKVVEKTLPGAVADCMVKALKATPFPEVDKCWDATLTIPVTFPTPP